MDLRSKIKKLLHSDSRCPGLMEDRILEATQAKSEEVKILL
jgi:hypothetical protein